VPQTTVRTSNWKLVKTEEEIELMRASSQLVARTLEMLRKMIAPGVQTCDLDRAAEEFIRSHDAIPAFKGYRGFPASICTSINSEVVHGIPSGRVLREGDIISIDVGVLKQGYHGDGAATYPVGPIDERKRKLLEVTKNALMAGIAAAKHGNRIADISRAIQSFVEQNGFSVVRDLVGHGIGQQMHEEPQIPNFVVPGDSPLLKSGMTLAIEPMVNAGTYEVIVRSDGWTFATKDGQPSAHFEHTVVVREDGAEILTVP